MPVVLPLGDVQDNGHRILLANAILVVPGATDRITSLTRLRSREPQSSPKMVRFPSQVTYNHLLTPRGQKLLDLTPRGPRPTPGMYGSGFMIGLA